ncbi:MAG: phosphoethanolamine transferase [Flavobacteriales bacterium]|nr:phosphoethanolamine transferase [Flavobacteriales bacterium]
MFAAVLSLPMLFSSQLIRIYAAIIGALVLGYSGAELWHVIEFRGFPDSATFFSLFVTNTNESWALLDNLFGFDDFLIVVGFWLLMAILHQLLRQIRIPRATGVYWSLMIAGLAAFSTLSYQNRLAPANFKTCSIAGGFNAYFSFLKEQDRFVGLLEKPVQFSGFKQKCNHENETHVIVIGESTSRHHMSLYDYSRITNPKLSANRNIISFSQVSSPHAHTFPALEKVLSFKSLDSNNYDLQDGTLLDLFNKAGYHTTWLSNQALSGKFETPVSVLASKADQKVFSNTMSGSEPYDEILLQAFKDATIKKGNKVIFVHLMGTHMSYIDRYPEKFDHFKTTHNTSHLTRAQQKYINTYDNAVRYNDHIIASLIDSLNVVQGVCSLLYFSDHGDEVFDYRNFHGHSDVIQSKYMVDIPFLFWTNEQYKTKNADIFKRAKNNVNSQYNTANFIHTASDLYDVHCDLTDPEKSLISHATINTPSYNNLTPCFTANDIHFESKLLCHRVNGIERLMEVKEHFAGFEIDLVFESTTKTFDVNHPPAESVGLSLDRLIASIENPEDYYYWFDLKNLDSLNQNNAAIQMQEIVSKYNLNDKVVIESPNINELKSFVELNFRTAFYLPDLQNYSEDRMYSVIDSLIPLINTVRPSALSQQFDAYSLLKQQFPNCDLLTWDLRFDLENAEDSQFINQLVTQQDRLKLFLVRKESDSYR